MLPWVLAQFLGFDMHAGVSPLSWEGGISSVSESLEKCPTVLLAMSGKQREGEGLN